MAHIPSEQNAMASKPYPFSDPLMAVNFATPDQKKDKEFGRKLISRIYREQNNNNSTLFYLGRTSKWKENWNWAYGRQPIQEFLDYMSVTDANKSYSNIDLSQDKTGPQFVETLVNAMAQNEEYAAVCAVDDGSKKVKQDQKEEALYRMHDVKEIDELQQLGGIPLEPPNAYVPDDELSADVYFELEAKLPIEIEFEKFLDKVMRDNEYPTLKRRLYRDLIVANCACTKIEKLLNGFIGIRKCITENLIYNFFLSDSGKMELSYIGEVYSLKVRDLRVKFGRTQERPDGLTEKEIFELASTATQGNVAGRWNHLWREDYNYQNDRPYDDYSVTVFDCEVQCFDSDYYVSKIDNYGRENIKPKNGVPSPQSERASVIKQGKTRWYRGVWAVRGDRMIYWGLPDVVITPYMDIAGALSSYTINIPNNDGNYIPSLFERAIPQLRKIQLSELKMNQLIAEMVPPGYTLDVESIRDIDLGQGKTLPWEKILNIRNQKGVVLWSSRGLNPNEINARPPIEGLPNAESVPQLNELANIMNAAMQRIRSLLGVPFYRDGSDVGERTAAKLAEGQSASSSNVTDFISEGFHQLIEQTLYKVTLIKWDDVVVQEGRMDVKDTSFQVAVEMKLTAYEKQKLEEMISVGMANQLISFVDAFRIRQIKNFKLAHWYLSQTTEKTKRDQAQAAARQAQQNNESQMAVAQESAKAEMDREESKHDLAWELEEMKSRNKKQEIMLQGVLEIYKLAMTPTKTEDGKTTMPTIPSDIQAMAAGLFQNVGFAVVKNTQDEQKEAVQEQELEQQLAQQQMMRQQQQAAAQGQGMGVDNQMQ